MYVILYADGIAMNAKLIFVKIILCNTRKKHCVKKLYNSYYNNTRKLCTILKFRS